MNKHLKFALFLIVYWAGIVTLLAQDDIKKYEFKKGEVLDILLLTNGPEAKTLFPNYRRTAFPVATKFSYTPIPGFPIAETVQGGVHPRSFIFGKWDSKEKREDFLEAIITEVPDFHEQRNAIWTYFAVTYYEITEDAQFIIDRSKYNVVTAYWGQGNSFKEFTDSFKEVQESSGGKEVLTLSNGTSPPGYYYNPEFLMITEWENKAAFESFNKEHQAFNEKRILNVHQFVLK